MNRMESQMEEPIKKKEYTIVNYVKHRIKNNKNFICAFTGPTGSGKSWSALSFAELTDPDFSIDNVVFKARDLMTLINSGNLKSGSVIVWDEAGIDLSNRNWQSNMNKLVNYLLQTFRHKNFILIFTVPYSDFIDSASRKMFHAEFQTIAVNKRKKTCGIKPKLLQYNSSMKKWYTKYLKARCSNGKIVKIKRWASPKPSDELIKAYEVRKSEFTSGLNDEIEESLQDTKGGDNKVKLKYDHRDLYIAYHLRTKVGKELSKLLGVNGSSICQKMKTMDKKYPEWRNDENMLGDLNNTANLELLSPSKLHFLGVLDSSDNKKEQPTKKDKDDEE